MAGAVMYIVFGVLLTIGGGTGEWVMKGTSSSAILVFVGLAMAIYGISRVVRIRRDRED